MSVFLISNPFIFQDNLSMPRRANHPGFTLVELIVVVAIVALLASLIMASLPLALERGKQGRCLGNMRQIGLAFQLYLQANNYRMPQRFYGETNGVLVGYDEKLLEFCEESHAIFHCPSHLKNDFPRQPSYGMNWYFDNSFVGGLDAPSQTILLTEVQGPGDKGSHRADRNSGSPGQLASQRHVNVAHFLFFDGHIAALRWEDTVFPLDMWGTDSGDHTRRD